MVEALIAPVEYFSFGWMVNSIAIGTVAEIWVIGVVVFRILPFTTPDGESVSPSVGSACAANAVVPIARTIDAAKIADNNFFITITPLSLLFLPARENPGRPDQTF